MAGPEFFQTRMGQVFYEGTMPALVRELKKLNENLEKTRWPDPNPCGEVPLGPAEVLTHTAPKPTGRDLETFRKFLTTLISEADTSGEAAGRLVGGHLDDMHNEDPTVIIEELENIEAWAASIRKKLL